MFPTANGFIEEHFKEGQAFLIETIKSHLDCLIESFNRYFPNDPRIGKYWIQQPFVDENISSCELPHLAQEQLLELSCDTLLKSKFQKLRISQFWLLLKEEYPLLYENAIKVLLIFSTTYLCEKTFSAMSLIKNKQRNKLDVDFSLRLSETIIQPDIKKLFQRNNSRNLTRTYMS